jgi:Glycosyltransferase family 87
MTLEFLKRADWLNEERLTGYARIFLALYLVMTVTWVALSPNLIDPNGKPIGPDFMNVWSAGKLALQGEPEAAYEYNRHYEIQRGALPYREDQVAPYFGWPYPPHFLAAAALLALLPYGAALAAWMAATLPVYLAAIRAIFPYRRWWLFALGFPAVFVNFSHGQNGFLSAGLLGLGLASLERRPLVAGLFFGLLTYKPQLGFLLPFVLLIDRRWVAFGAASVTAVALGALSYAAFGAETWQAFVASFEPTRTYVLEQGPTGWQKLQSAFAAMRNLGASIETAYAVQAVVTLTTAAAVLWIWRRPVAMSLKGSALATGTLLVTPYVLDYDLMLLALPLAWLTVEGLRTQFLNWEKLTLFGVWLLPLVSRELGTFNLPIGPVVLLLLLSMILRRAMVGQMSVQGVAAQPL